MFIFDIFIHIELKKLPQWYHVIHIIYVMTHMPWQTCGVIDGITWDEHDMPPMSLMSGHLYPVIHVMHACHSYPNIYSVKWPQHHHVIHTIYVMTYMPRRVIHVMYACMSCLTPYAYSDIYPVEERTMTAPRHRRLIDRYTLSTWSSERMIHIKIMKYHWVESVDMKIHSCTSSILRLSYAQLVAPPPKHKIEASLKLCFPERRCLFV